MLIDSIIAKFWVSCFVYFQEMQEMSHREPSFNLLVDRSRNRKKRERGFVVLTISINKCLVTMGCQETIFSIFIV